MTDSRLRLGPPVGLLALLAVLSLPQPARAGVTLTITPATQTVALGATFDVTIVASATDGAKFNAVALRIGFDPTALTPVPLAPLSSQLGSYMTSACSNIFHRFGATAAAESADASMFCNGTYLYGTGTVYRLRFTAANTVRTTTLTFQPNTQLIDGGLFVTPLITHDAAIGIGTAATLGLGDASHPGRLALSAGPNPSRDGALLQFGTALSREASIAIIDLQGRTVRRMHAVAGARAQWWDGRDAQGVKVAAGEYLMWVCQGERWAATRVTVVR